MSAVHSVYSSRYTALWSLNNEVSSSANLCHVQLSSQGKFSGLNIWAVLRRVSRTQLIQIGSITEIKYHLSSPWISRNYTSVDSFLKKLRLTKMGLSGFFGDQCYLIPHECHYLIRCSAWGMVSVIFALNPWLKIVRFSNLWICYVEKCQPCYHKMTTRIQAKGFFLSIDSSI